jgi:hypothetical protein
MEGAGIVGLTPIGQVTANLLRLNDGERLIERILLLQVGHQGI